MRIADSVLQILDNLESRTLKFTATRREFHLTCCAVEQAKTQLCLKVSDVLRKCGLSQFQSLGRLREATQFGNSKKNLYLTKRNIHIRHRSWSIEFICTI